MWEMKRPPTCGCIENMIAHLYAFIHLECMAYRRKAVADGLLCARTAQHCDHYHHRQCSVIYLKYGVERERERERQKAVHKNNNNKSIITNKAFRVSLFTRIFSIFISHIFVCKLKFFIPSVVPGREWSVESLLLYRPACGRRKLLEWERIHSVRSICYYHFAIS